MNLKKTIKHVYPARMHLLTGAGGRLFAQSVAEKARVSGMSDIYASVKSVHGFTDTG